MGAPKSLGLASRRFVGRIQVCSEGNGKMRIMCPQKKTSIHIQKEWQVWLLGKVLDCYSCSLLLCAAMSPQSCPTLCNPIDGSPPGSAIPGILQARTLEGLPFPSPMHESEK